MVTERVELTAQDAGKLFKARGDDENQAEYMMGLVPKRQNEERQLGGIIGGLLGGLLPLGGGLLNGVLQPLTGVLQHVDSE